MDDLNYLVRPRLNDYHGIFLNQAKVDFAIPCLDEEGNEKWILVKVSIPRGSRNGEGGYDPYDGYSVAEDYQFDLADKAKKKRAAEEQKAKKIAADEKKRAEKKALAEANKNLKELRKIKVTPEA